MTEIYEIPHSLVYVEYEQNFINYVLNMIRI